VKLCTSCSAQFEDEYKRCLHCGAKLQAGSPAQRASSGGFATGPSETRAGPELVLIHRGGVAETRELSGLMDQMSVAHQIEVDEQADDGRGGSRTTLSMYVAKSDEQRAKQAIQTLEVGELSQAHPNEENEEVGSETGLSRNATLIGNAIGVIVSALILLTMLFRALR